MDQELTFSSSLDQRTRGFSFGFGMLIVLAILVCFMKPLITRNSADLYSIVIGVVIAIGLAIVFVLSPKAVLLDRNKIQILRRLGRISIALTRVTGFRQLNTRELSGSLRLFAVGGLFGWFGLFTSRDLGRFTMYATRQDNLILFTLTNNDQVVISVDDVQAFMKSLTEVKQFSNNPS